MGGGSPFLACLHSISVALRRVLGVFSFRMLWIDYSGLLPFYSIKQPHDSVLTGHRLMQDAPQPAMCLGFKDVACKIQSQNAAGIIGVRWENHCLP